MINNQLRSKEEVLNDLRRCMRQECESCPGKDLHNGPHCEGECQWPIRLVSAAHDIISGDNPVYADTILDKHIEALSQIRRLCSNIPSEYMPPDTLEEALDEIDWMLNILWQIDDLTWIDISEVPYDKSESK